ncbi:MULTISPECIES: PIN domain-containing protein [unclassified Acinetobacter]|uniref:PIN domain-containing protein n=1 Tax=unclassified Acinetobacter TaxID=196816 RepID=UPI00244BD7AB|nr:MULTISPECIES: PIN domain-containing protein [unclassified Acinetobacter]MDH0030634.1 PIN domain-containing protein [Acinetobacter sp. GD04021]MDH0886255.1 PIN domain-containing protein [Acinetobacter sp. GD03873]MDH1081770.1 PIN domain-containing protein [Acinetobacter sp. GD03983]MDH2189732.1 PIN domain-containing protein [Acinetobacter sp. GD03645]MDH2202724.1 PIN domain-containing protein [Acinetobacter sp. GD03647]
MSERIFIDSDVILDVALARQPFVEASHQVLALCEKGNFTGCISSNSIANIYYILRKSGGDEKARLFIKQILKFMVVIPVDHVGISRALDSKFTDFEGAIKHFAALSFGCIKIVTRNIQDYKFAELNEVLPIEFK